MIATGQGSRPVDVSVAVTRRRVVALAFAALVVVAVLGVVYVHEHRFDGGPLHDPSFGGVGAWPVRVGRPVSFSAIWLVNRGGKSITLERVAPRALRPGTRVRFWALPLGTQPPVDVVPFPPAGVPASRLRPIAGFTVEPGRTERIQLLAEIVPTRSGCVGFEGLDIDYRTGFRRYRRHARELWFHGNTKNATGCPRQ